MEQDLGFPLNPVLVVKGDRGQALDVSGLELGEIGDVVELRYICWPWNKSSTMIRVLPYNLTHIGTLRCTNPTGDSGRRTVIYPYMGPISDDMERDSLGPIEGVSEGRYQYRDRSFARLGSR